MTTLKDAIAARRSQLPERIHQQADTTLTLIQAKTIELTSGRPAAERKAREIIRQCREEINQAKKADRNLPAVPQLSADATAEDALNEIIAWTVNATGKKLNKLRPDLELSKKESKTRPPKDEYMRIYQAAENMPECTQTQLAEKISDACGNRISQQKVSAAIKRVREFRRSQGLPDAVGDRLRRKSPSRVVVDPLILDRGPRTDRRRSRGNRHE